MTSRAPAGRGGRRRRDATTPPETGGPDSAMAHLPRDPESLIVGDAARLAETCEALRAAGGFAFDTEFIGEQSYRPRVCLVQAATAERVALIDPLQVDLRPFWDLVADPSIEKIVHSGQQDVELCWQAIGRAPANLFDVQVAAGFVGHPYPASYERLARTVLGAHVGKGETFTDWARRPLSSAQLRYAVVDVLHLPHLKARFAAELAGLGRAGWLREEMSRLESPSFYAREGQDAWERVRGTARLSRRGQAVLRELAAWRERAAEAQDLPPRTVLRDEVLLAVARRLPQDARALHAIRGFPSPLVRRCGAEIMEAIARGRAARGEDRPEADREERPGDRMLVDLAIAAGQGLCLAGNVAHGLLAARADYEDLVAALTGTGRPADAPPRLLAGWRSEFAGRTLAAVFEGRASLRVSGLPDRPRLDVV